MTPLDRLVAHARETDYERLPPPAVAATKTFLLDTVGVGMAGGSGALVDALLRVGEAWGGGDDATVWGRGRRLPAPSAALVNAYLIHCLEFDCVHERAVLHPMATVVGALSAWCERRSRQGRPVPGAALIAALAVAVDVATLLGVAATGPIRFFRPAIAGGLGAVAGIGCLERFDADTLANAFGIQYGQLSGTLQPHVEGVPLLGLQIGFNARAAIQSCDLAAAGFIGPKDILTGRYGYFPLYEDGKADLPAALALLGREWQMTRLAHKPYPSGRLTHGVVHALRELTERQGVRAEEIAALTARVPPLVARLVGRPDEPDPAANYAKLCLPFVAGVWATKGRCDVPDFLGESLRDPAVHAFAARVTVEEDGNPDPNAMAPQRFIARLHDGRAITVELPQVYGHPEAPLSDAENMAKFRRCWANAVPALPAERADAVIAFIAGLESQPDAAALVPLLVA